MDGEPQKSHRLATCEGSNTEIALQLWHLTFTVSAPYPRRSSPMPERVFSRSCSVTPAASAGLEGCSLGMKPQYGQASACFAAFHSISPPQSGQGRLPSAVTELTRPETRRSLLS